MQLLGEPLSLLLRVDILCLFDERKHIAHAEDTGRHSVGVELLEIVELLAHADIFDRLARDGQHGERRTASGIGIELGHQHARDAECFVECLCNIDGILTGHRINDEHDLIRLCFCLDIFQLIHELFVDMQTARRIENDDIVVVILRVFHALHGDIDRVDLTEIKDRDLRLSADDLELVDRGRTVNVTGDEQRMMTVLFELLCELGAVRRFTGALQAAEHDDGRGL